MLKKAIVYFRKEVILACDGQCNKAWGINGRPKIKLSKDADDYGWKGDDELEQAGWPGSWEGGDGRPSDKPLKPRDAHLMNKWCARECERSGMFAPSEPIVLRNMKKPAPNISRADDEKTNG